ncbi:hypothetical protein E2C01_028819 [Portunus trituberculatus]|uniref:Uncharacterized protein n=1 Tax=Portunus trituberculatus TaxID=210409 RepID=A0A5B7EQ47_PORTR|nr:hypothetical protein [Portunus trituberculatus]
MLHRKRLAYHPGNTRWPGLSSPSPREPANTTDVSQDLKFQGTDCMEKRMRSRGVDVGRTWNAAPGKAFLRRVKNGAK